MLLLNVVLLVDVMLELNAPYKNPDLRDMYDTYGVRLCRRRTETLGHFVLFLTSILRR